MKAKFNLGFLTGFRDVPHAWPGMRQAIPVLEPLRAYPIDNGDAFEQSEASNIKHMIFECRSIDDDKAAVFELLEIR